MNVNELRVMVIGAHPDDADLMVGGTAIRLTDMGAVVEFVSLTNGNKGHQTLSPAALDARRRDEAARSAQKLGLHDYVVMGTNDCELAATLEARREVTRLMRRFAPHLVFAPRTCDYHPDHRAAGTLVMDSAYLFGVPHWCPDTPVPAVRPAIFLMRDGFTYPRKLRADVMVPVDEQMPRLLDALACHETQFFEWLPYDMGLEAELPPAGDAAARRDFIYRNWVAPRKAVDADEHRAELVARLGAARGRAIRAIECFELSEYGAQPTPDELKDWFPFAFYK